MTETQTTEQTPEPTRNVVPRENLDDLNKMLLTQAEGFVKDWQTVNGRLTAQTDFEKALPDLRKSSEDPEVKRLQEQIDKANEAILKWTNNQDAILLAGMETLTDDERKALEEQRNALKVQIKAAVTFFEGMATRAGNDGTLADYIPDVSSVVKTRDSGGASGKHSGEPGTRRLRVKQIYVQGPAMQPDSDKWESASGSDKSTFTHLVGWFDKKDKKVTVPDLHKAYFETAGTEDFEKITNTLDFAHSVDGDTYWVRVVKHSD